MSDATSREKVLGQLSRKLRETRGRLAEFLRGSPARITIGELVDWLQTDDDARDYRDMTLVELIEIHRGSSARTEVSAGEAPADDEESVRCETARESTAAAPSSDAPVGLEEAISTFLAAGGPATREEIRAAVGGADDDVAAALAELRAGARIEEVERDRYRVTPGRGR